MIKRLFLGVLTVLISVTSTVPVFADTPEPPEPFLPVIISEVYPNAPGSSESGKEFVEIQNLTDQVFDMTGYTLRRKGTTINQVLNSQTVEPEGYIVIYPSFALLNSGGTIVLEPPSNSSAAVLEVAYPNLDEAHSWSLVGEVWQAEAPTPGVSNPEPPPPPEPEPEPVPEPQPEPEPQPDPAPEESPAPEPEPEPEIPAEEQSPVCAADSVIITEIIANPSGADTDGGEYVELFNGGSQSLDLVGCTLTTDKVAGYSLDGLTVPANEYLAVELFDDLLNGGGSVTFASSQAEDTVQYPELGDDDAWALISGSWQTTKLATPGNANLPTPVNIPAANNNEAETEELEPCAAGKFRNPATNRCKNIIQTASSLLPCGPGETRNPETNRCRKTTTLGAAASLTPCKPDQERNPATNRCRKVAGSSKASLVPCQEGYERSPDTKRCRKVTNAVGGTAAFPVNSPAPLHPGILVSMTLLAVGYGIYEYRLDFANWYARLRNRFTKSKLL